MNRTALAGGLLALSMAVSAPAIAQNSPVFGSAKAERLSVADAKNVKAKGYWANYYGSLGNTAAYNAYIYGYYARWYAAANSTTEQNWYYTAHSYSADAYIYYYYAYVNSFYGQ
jgi:cytochrome c biogenesis factor